MALFTYSESGRAAFITIQSPPKNMVSVEAVKEMTQRVRTLAAGDSINVLVLQAEGEFFCGGRLADPAFQAAVLMPGEIRTQLAEPMLDFTRALRDLPIPVVAKVNGNAVGLGAAIVGACDLAIASERAQFSFPELQHNLAPTLAVCAIAQKVSPKAAASLVIGGATFDARAAREAGLVGEVVAHDALDARVQAIVDDLGQRQFIAVSTLKRYFRAVYTPNYNLNAELASSMLATAISSWRSAVN